MKRPFLPFISLTVCVCGASNHWSPAAWPPSCSPLRTLHTSALFRLAPLCSAQLQARHICKFQKLHLLRQEREPAQAILISAGDRRVAPMY